MKKITAFIHLLLTGLLINSALYGQVRVDVSDQIETYGGKQYYIHTVEARQTLFGISQAYRITVEELTLANPEVRSGLRLNQILRIPIKQPASQAQAVIQSQLPAAAGTSKQEVIYHVAIRNESFRAIANIYQVSEDKIRQINPGLTEPLGEGQYVSVPIGPLNNANAELIPSTTIRQPQTAEPVIERQEQTESIRQPEPYTLINVAPQKSDETIGTAVAINASHKESSKIHYVVQPQDTYYSIARTHNITVEQLLLSNPDYAPTLAIGETLIIPEPLPEKTFVQNADTSVYIKHKVTKGETLYRISRNYATSIVILNRHNPGLTDNLSIGQVILIPKKQITSPYIEHRVEDRARARVVAREFEISLNEFYEFNPAAGRLVYPGQLVRIPIADHLKVAPVMPAIMDSLQIEVELTDVFPEKLVFCQEESSYAGQKFRIALMIPLHLKDAEKLIASSHNNPATALTQRPFSFLQFYEGFMMAVDSLVKHSGLNAEIYVYDVNQEQSSINAVLNDPKLKGVDLIVGPFFNRSFELLANFARQHEIPIVNPMAQRSEIVNDFPNVFKVKPNNDCQYDQLAAFISTNYSDAKIFVYRAQSFTADAETKKLLDALYRHAQRTVHIPNSRIYNLAEKQSRSNGSRETIPPFITVENQRFSTDQLRHELDQGSIFDNSITELVFANDGIDGFVQNASSVRDNIVIAISEDNVFAMELVNNLNQVADGISLKLIGLPNWRNFDNLFIESLLKLQIHHLVQTHIDYSAYQTQRFINNFRMQYNTEPDSYAFEGFDIAWFFIQALMHYDNKLFDCIHHFNPELTSTQFHFLRKSKSDGFENCYWNLYRYQDYKLVPLNNAYYQSGIGH